jgi:hypothetical protein
LLALDVGEAGLFYASGCEPATAQPRNRATGAILRDLNGTGLTILRSDYA